PSHTLSLHDALPIFSSIGLSGGLAPGEMLNIDYANVDACARALAENPDVVLGVKVRITDNVVGQNGVEPLRRARRAAELAGKGLDRKSTRLNSSHVA